MSITALNHLVNMIYLYDTLTQKKRLFEPLVPDQVSLYVCGVTAYDHCHIGHARAYIVFDILKRHLIHSGYTVNHIQNFTDIDDKLIKKASDSQVTVKALSDRFTQSFFEDMTALNIMPATHYPKATDHIQTMQDYIQILLDKNIAFIHTTGDVMFDISQFDSYGNLSKKVLAALESGHRELHGYDQNFNQNFVLWKLAKPGEPTWDSPWGAGRPGWHIECSAMAMQYLGPTIDIHGGGEDLIFPHHENERAQSESCSGQPFARYWVHNGFVTTNHKKMSKSLKNSLSIRSLLKTVDPMVLRFYLMRTHYRNQFQFSNTGLQESQISLDKLQAVLAQPDTHPTTDRDQANLTGYHDRFFAYLNDDINTAGAIGVLFDLAKSIQKTGSGRSLLTQCLNHIGITIRATKPAKSLSNETQALLNQRETARAAKDFKQADDLRDALLAHGIAVKDTRTGSSWHYIN